MSPNEIANLMVRYYGEDPSNPHYMLRAADSDPVVQFANVGVDAVQAHVMSFHESYFDARSSNITISGSDTEIDLSSVVSGAIKVSANIKAVVRVDGNKEVAIPILRDESAAQVYKQDPTFRLRSRGGMAVYFEGKNLKWVNTPPGSTIRITYTRQLPRFVAGAGAEDSSAAGDGNVGISNTTEYDTSAMPGGIPVIGHELISLHGAHSACVATGRSTERILVRMSMLTKNFDILVSRRAKFSGRDFDSPLEPYESGMVY